MIQPHIRNLLNEIRSLNVDGWKVADPIEPGPLNQPTEYRVLNKGIREKKTNAVRPSFSPILRENVQRRFKAIPVRQNQADFHR